MQIALERRHVGYKPSFDGSSHGQIDWVMGLPFATTKQGLLAHRVRRASSHLREGEYTHDSCDFLCGNCGASPHFLADPGDRLVCQRCEAVAKSKGLPSADRIVGRHVHVGRLRVEKICCKDDSN